MSVETKWRCLDVRSHSWNVYFLAETKFECLFMYYVSNINTKFELKLLDFTEPVATILALPLDVRELIF